MIKAIGIGNRLMMDDGIAVAVLENLKKISNQRKLKLSLEKPIFNFALNS